MPGNTPGNEVLQRFLGALNLGKENHCRDNIRLVARFLVQRDPVTVKYRGRNFPFFAANA
jgi:hypothetical protein